MAVGADERIGEGDRARRGPCRRNTHLGEVFEIHLVHDAGARRHDAEVVERLLAPAEELVALAVALNSSSTFRSSASARAEVVDLHRVVDHQVDRHSGLIFFGSPPSRCIAARIAARSTTHGTPVKSCSTTRAGLKGISTLAGDGGVPGGERLHVVFGHHVAVAVAQQRFQQHADRKRQRGDVAQAGVFELREAIDAGLAAAGVERVAGGKRIGLQVRRYSWLASFQSAGNVKLGKFVIRLPNRPPSFEKRF